MFTPDDLKKEFSKYVIKQPPVAHSISDLVKLLEKEQRNAQSALSNTSSFLECESNLRQLPDAFVNGINRATMLTVENIDGIDELCPEMSNYISIFSISVRVISGQLCDTIRNDFMFKVNYIFDLLIRLFRQIEEKKKKQLNKITAMLWTEFEEFKKTPLDNQTAVTTKILQNLSVMRDAKSELEKMIVNELNINLKLPLTRANNSNSTKNEIYYSRLTYDFVLFINDCIHHIYLFLLKYYKSNKHENTLTFLQKIINNISKLPEFVDEICCIVYTNVGDNDDSDNDNDDNDNNNDNENKNESKDENGNDKMKRELQPYGLVLLQLIWNVISVNAESCAQFRNRRMVINSLQFDAQSKRYKKVKIGMKGDEWKQKFLQQWNIFCLLFEIDNQTVFGKSKKKKTVDNDKLDKDNETKLDDEKEAKADHSNKNNNQNKGDEKEGTNQ